MQCGHATNRCTKSNTVVQDPRPAKSRTPAAGMQWNHAFVRPKTRPSCGAGSWAHRQKPSNINICSVYREGLKRFRVERPKLAVDITDGAKRVSLRTIGCWNRTRCESLVRVRLLARVHIYCTYTHPHTYMTSRYIILYSTRKRSRLACYIVMIRSVLLASYDSLREIFLA